MFVIYHVATNKPIRREDVFVATTTMCARDHKRNCWNYWHNAGAVWVCAMLNSIHAIFSYLLSFQSSCSLLAVVGVAKMNMPVFISWIAHNYYNAFEGYKKVVDIYSSLPPTFSQHTILPCIAKYSISQISKGYYATPHRYLTWPFIDRYLDW